MSRRNHEFNCGADSKSKRAGSKSKHDESFYQAAAESARRKEIRRKKVAKGARKTPGVIGQAAARGAEMLWEHKKEQDKELREDYRRMRENTHRQLELMRQGNMQMFQAMQNRSTTNPYQNCYAASPPHEIYHQHEAFQRQQQHLEYTRQVYEYSANSSRHNNYCRGPYGG